MEELYSQSIQGCCAICKCELGNGGYIYLNSQSSITKLLCPVCRDFEKEEKTTVKKGRLVVKRLTGLFGWQKGWYEILSARNLIIKDSIIKEQELLKLVDNPNVEVVVKA